MDNIQYLSVFNNENVIQHQTYELKKIIFDYRYNKVILNGKTVALLALDYEYEELNGCIMIESFEVFEKGTGIGTIVIEELLNAHKGRKFCLYSEPGAEKFWRGMGFLLDHDEEGADIYFYGLN